MKKGDIVADFVALLKKDKEMRHTFAANIAMAYIDAEVEYKKETGKKYLNSSDKHGIANNAAENFLWLLCK